MLGRMLNIGARFRFALWLAGKAMPRPKDLQPYVNKTVLGAIITIACGVFAATGIMVAMFAIYAYATGLAVLHQPAMFMAAAVFLLLATLGYMVVSRALTKTLSVSKSPHKDVSKSSLASAFDATIDGFIEGFTTQPKTSAKPNIVPENTPPRSTAYDEKVIPIVRAHASASDILHRHPKTRLTH